MKRPEAAPGGERYAVQLKADREAVDRLGLNVEIGQAVDLDELELLLPIITSGHAPFGFDGQRLNIAAVDDDFREMSIAMITAYIEAASALPNLRKVNVHAAPKRWHSAVQTGGRKGDYGRLVEALRRIGEAAAAHGLHVVIENNRCYWEGVSEETPIEEVDRSAQNYYFTTAPEEWIGLCEDVSMENVRLCLDSSHACTYAHVFGDVERRRQAMDRFLSRPDLIGHVHWNGNDIDRNRGRDDCHLCVGAGTLGDDFHRRIKSLPATKLLEHWHGTEALDREMQYIGAL